MTRMAVRYKEPQSFTIRRWKRPDT